MSSRKQHSEWLSLVEVSGPFLSTPVLERVFRQGLDAHDPDLYRTLRLAFEEWEENQEGRRPNPAIHNAWIKFVLKETLDLPDKVLAEGQAIPQTLKATVAEHGETLRPDLVVQNPEDGSDAGKSRLLIQVYPLDQNLEKPVTGRHWKASPATRMMELLHSTDVRLGLVTNGEHWMLVDAPRNETTGFASWYASLWLEEKITLQAFRSLLGVHRFFSASESETLEAMLAESAKHQQEVTDQLGLQVRRAVEVLIQSLDRADQDHGRQLLGKVPETVLYEAALTVMMRLVILFCAEERGMLLLGDPLYDEHYAVSTLVAQLQEAADQHGEEVLERRLDAWARLLATFRAVFGGVEHERMKLPPYAGNLFNPDRFPFLEGRRAGTLWRNTAASPLPVNNRTVLHLLRSLQYLELHGEARRLSFRALDIEQIGHVYEGLLDHTAKRATEPVLGLIGAKGQEPEVALSELERLKTKGEDKIIEFLQEETRRSENALRKALDPALETGDVNRLRAVSGNDEALFKRARPFAGIIRDDTFGRPVIIPTGGVYVTAGTERRSTGTHYTPRSLTEPIVQYTLEPLVYIGPAEGKPKEEWKLRSPGELLDLKICDMACGSGAFLVQTARYLSELLVEAWERAETEHPKTPGITPEGKEATGSPAERLIPKDADERLIYARRLIAQRCLYGVDKDPLAAEMAKLSLWLLTLAKDKPFTFLDHAIRNGDSLLGITSLDQLRYFSLDAKSTERSLFTGPVMKLVDEAVDLRKRIAARDIDTIEDVQAEEQLLSQVEEKIARLRYAADLLISVEFQPGSAKEKEDVHNQMAIQAGYYVEKGELEEFSLVVRRALDGWHTFHWPLEFPEVFVDRGGFDGFVCNPPYLGGKRIRTELGGSYGAALKALVTPDEKGAADLAAFFQRRSYELLSIRGVTGMILTNTISEGTTRLIGPEAVLSKGGRITFADPDRPWPGGANVLVSLLIIGKGERNDVPYFRDRQVSEISSFLSEQADFTTPFVLQQHPAIASTGTSLNGEGFIVEQSEASTMVSRHSFNKKVLEPYLVAEDLNSRPDQSPSRLVINFGEMSQAEAERYVEPFSRVRELVKPARDALKNQIHETCFWKHWDKRSVLYQSLGQIRSAIVCGRVSKHLAFAVVPTGIVFSDRLVVVASDRFDLFAILQSVFHTSWVEQLQTSMGQRVGYSVSKCYSTFPWPGVAYEINPNELIEAGERLHEARSKLMSSKSLGLTDVYNRFHNLNETDSSIQRLRALHAQMDKVVGTGYGWADLNVERDFNETKLGIRFTISEQTRREVLARLLALNHKRHAEEEREELHDKKNKAKRAASLRGRATSNSAGNLVLFGDTDLVGDGDPGRDISRNVSSPVTTSRQPAAIEGFDTDEVMAAFRQAARGQGAVTRDELLKEVSTILGYQRLGSKVDDTLRGHLRAAIRRGIIEDDAGLVRPATATMNDYSLEELRTALCSVMRKGTNYEREEATYAVARHLGFARVTDSVREAIKSAINSGIRQGTLGCEASLIWREQ
jgi:Eco57I restriction-modification methylase/restriction-modification enzyme MmeI-like protein